MTRITVLMSVYNDAAFVEEAVSSILRQSYADFELLIVDDASTDRSAEIISGFGDPRIRVLRNERNLGLTRSLNVGLAAARTDLIARHDADDVSFPDRLQCQVEAFQSRPELVLLGAQTESINEDGKRLRSGRDWTKCVTPRGIEWQMMFENAFAHSTVMFRRDVVAGELGGYNEDFRTNQDYELWSRVIARYEAANLDRPLLFLRGRARGMSKQYSRDALHLLGDRMVEWRSHALRRTCRWDEGLRLLLAVANPAICAPVDDLGPLVASIREMLSRFEQVNPDAVQTPEIRRHVASLLRRVANLIAPHAPAEAYRVLRAAREYDSEKAWSSVFWIGARAVAGAATGRGRATGTEELKR